MAVISTNNLPNEVLSIIVVATGDTVLCSKVCKTWAHAIQQDPFLYVKIFDEWMKNKNIAPLLTYLPNFVPQPSNDQALDLVKLAYRQILAEVKEYVPFSREKTFSVVYSFFENVQTMKLITYWEHWDHLSKLRQVPATHPKQLEQHPRAKAEQIRCWMKLGFNKPKSEEQIDEIDLSSAGILGLPSEFFEQVKEVQNIILRHNNLKSLPPGISQCTELIALDLQDNPVQSLPLELGLCPNLAGVYLDQITFETARVPQEIKHLIQVPEMEEDWDIGDKASEVKIQPCPIL